MSIIRTWNRHKTSKSFRAHSHWVLLSRRGLSYFEIFIQHLDEWFCDFLKEIFSNCREKIQLRLSSIFAVINGFSTCLTACSRSAIWQKDRHGYFAFVFITACFANSQIQEHQGIDTFAHICLVSSTDQQSDIELRYCNMQWTPQDPT